ncbi:MAG: hypothetical protein H0U49_12435 [Parachlamydiaceae bacterium]|nr:hypothetical protein [Parachlamydiaceae bacterium]
MKNYALTDFQILRPRHETTQEKGLEWLAKAHAKTEMTKQPDLDGEQLYQDFLQRFMHIGCKPEHIHQRGHELPDFLHHDWPTMEIFRLDQSTFGAGLKQRQEFHDKATDAIFEKYYPLDSLPPKHLIHVSCTGYSSPSSAQKIVSKRSWGDQTLVTHAYHMGCYASIPAIRMGGAFVQTEGGQTDIVHTELCTLHFNPSNHNPDQIVLQSLFADGYIKYSIKPIIDLQRDKSPYLQVVTSHEELIPTSIEAMTWTINDWGFEGTLSKKIPFLIARNIRSFIDAIAKNAGTNAETLLNDALLAIHPGGPKILDHIQEILQLSSEQLRFSRKILQNYGNISSGTLPHMWEAISKDESVIGDTLILGLAFGPGLTIAGIILRKKTF